MSHLVPDEVKYKCIRRTAATIPRGQVSWKMADYERNPVENVIFGDSRMTHLNADYFTTETGEPTFNFAIAGGNLQTSIDFFWFCTEHIKLKRAFFQVGFINFNDNVNYDIVEPYFKYKENLLNYFTGRSVCIDTYAVIYYLIGKSEKFVDINHRERKIDLWKRGYDLIDLRLTEYAYPDNFLAEFEKISAYCTENDIELKFIRLPNHTSFSDKLTEYDKEGSFKAYCDDLERLGGLIYPFSLEEFTRNDDNFKDVFHFYTNYADSISSEVWKQYLVETEIPILIENMN
jgi:hypothetical protein